jgi:hypothetical protein
MEGKDGYGDDEKKGLIFKKNSYYHFKNSF